MTATCPKDLKFDANGLIPAIAQDAATGDVLMHAYMNREAVDLSRETGFAHYYSRSRGRIWRKGEESGHVQRIREIRYDCDADTLLLAVEQEVAACHTGNRSCFYRVLGAADGGTEQAALRFDPAAVYGGLGVLASLYASIRARRQDPQPESPGESGIAGGDAQIRAKLADGAAEVLQASQGGDRARLVAGMATLWFRALELLAEHDIRPEEIAGALGRGPGGKMGSPATPSGDSA
ncbi:MAG: phosphoribosyl-AMP cyclohydrolase [Candidatus Methylomirabilota bacterium]